MEPIADARREAALEIQKLAEDFERDDEAAFRRSRIACWVGVAIVTIMIMGLLMIGGDWRYLGVFWVIIVGLTWAGYALSSRRQRQQTGRPSGPLPPGGGAWVQWSARTQASVRAFPQGTTAWG